MLEEGDADIATLGVEIADEAEKTNPNVVKIVGSPIAPDRLRALYFTRATAPWGEGPLYHHIGIYAYRRAALERFVGLGPQPARRRASGWSSCARSKRACASMSASSIPFRWASIRPKISSAPAPCLS